MAPEGFCEKRGEEAGGGCEGSRDRCGNGGGDGFHGSRALLGRHRTQPPRIALQRWGLAPEQAETVLADCRQRCGGAWRIGEAPGEPPDVVLHLVDAGGLAGDRGRAAWNAMGPVHALRSARQRGTIELAIVLGNVALLPTVRGGCWVQSGQRGLARTVQLLLQAMSDSRMPDSSQIDALRRLASLDATVSLFAFPAGADTQDGVQVCDMLQGIVNAAVVSPMQTWVSAPATLHGMLSACLCRDGGVSKANFRLVASRDPDSVCGLIALPWPDLLEG